MTLKELESAPLEESIPLLRKLGVSSIKLDNIAISLSDTFFPVGEAKEGPSLPKEIECVCDHPLTDHSPEGYCLHGCDGCEPKSDNPTKEE